jgi:endonuclease/exonuclease/phosphatase family metal-dependent hydrolase
LIFDLEDARAAGVNRCVKLRRVVTLVALAAAALLVRRACTRTPAASAPAADARALRIATFNIERFGAVEKDTDLGRLITLVDDLAPDVLAVQEIEHPGRFARVVERLGRGRRTYALALSRCGGASEMRVGFVYDTARVRLDGVDEYPELDPRGEGACSRGERPGLVGRFTRTGDGGGRFALLAVHLAARGDEEFAMKRRAQWRRAVEIIAALRMPAAMLGDTNSTGWRDDRHGERTFIHDLVTRAGLRLATDGLDCSEYYEHDGRLEPSMLDHVVTTRDFALAGATVHGYCARLGCRAVDAREAPVDYRRVSDHCPVSVE